MTNNSKVADKATKSALLDDYKKTVSQETQATAKRDTDRKIRKNKAYWMKANTVFQAIGDSGEFMAVTRQWHKHNALYAELATRYGQGQLFSMQKLRVETVTNDKGHKREVITRNNANYCIFIVTSADKDDNGSYPAYAVTHSGKKWTQGSGDFAMFERSIYWVSQAIKLAAQSGKFNGKKFHQNDSPVLLKVDNASAEPAFYMNADMK